MSSDFSRFGLTSVFGKLTAELPKVKVSEETHEAATIEARKSGLTLSEWVRDLVMIRVHGIDMVLKMHQARLNVVSGNAPDEGEERGAR